MSISDLNAIKDNLKTILDNCNTTTAAPIYLSNNLSQPVNTIMKVNPEMIRMEPTHFPVVTCWIDEKTYESETISRNSAYAVRKSKVSLKIAGVIWNNITDDFTKDESDDDCENLMENIELILRSNVNLGGAVAWLLPRNVEYHSGRLGEETHLKAGILSIECTVLY